MSDNKDEPSFPAERLEIDDQGIPVAMQYFGLSKREYTAIKIMQALITNNNPKRTDKEDAKFAIRIADALLAELAKGKKDE